MKYFYRRAAAKGRKHFGFQDKIGLVRALLLEVTVAYGINIFKKVTQPRHRTTREATALPMMRGPLVSSTQQNEGRHKHTVDYRGPEQHPDSIQVPEVENESDTHCCAHYSVISAGALRRQSQGSAPSGFCYDIGAGPASTKKASIPVPTMPG